MRYVNALSRNPVEYDEKPEKAIIMSITEGDWLLSVQLQGSQGELYSWPRYAQSFVKTININKNLLVIVDSFAKFVFIFVVCRVDSTGVINELENLSKVF